MTAPTSLPDTGRPPAMRSQDVVGVSQAPAANTGGVEPETTPPATGAQDFYGPLPADWVAVTHFRPGHGDEPDMYAGPLLSETEKQITVEVYGDPLTFWKQDCIIDRPKATRS